MEKSLEFWRVRSPLYPGGEGIPNSHGSGGCDRHPHPCLFPQARDFARKLEALKPLFVEPRSKAGFSEVRARWAPLTPWLPRAGRHPYQLQAAHG